MSAAANRVVERLRAAVQANCNVTDARHARNMTLCTYLLEMRELYRWERGIALATPLPRAEIGAWIARREALWEALEDADYLPLPLAGRVARSLGRGHGQPGDRSARTRLRRGRRPLRQAPVLPRPARAAGGPQRHAHPGRGSRTGARPLGGAGVDARRDGLDPARIAGARAGGAGRGLGAEASGRRAQVRARCVRLSSAAMPPRSSAWRRWRPKR